MAIADDFLDTGTAKFFQGQQLTGTFAVTGTAITGTGSALTTELVAGQMVYDPVSRGIRKIASTPSSTTAATLDVAFNGNLTAGSTLYAMTDTGDTKGGIDIEWSTETFEKETDRRGKVGEVISDRNAKVTVPFAEWRPENLKRAMAELLPLVTSSTKKLFRFSKSIGLDLTTLGTPCVVIPVLNGVETTDPNRIIVFHNLCPSKDTVQIKFGRTDQRPITASFMAWGLPDGEIGYVGDNSIRP